MILVDARKLTQMARTLGLIDKEISGLAANTINRAATFARKTSTESIIKEFNLKSTFRKKSDFQKYLIVENRASRDNPQSQLVTQSLPIGLLRFPHKIIAAGHPTRGKIQAKTRFGAAQTTKDFAFSNPKAKRLAAYKIANIRRGQWRTASGPNLVTLINDYYEIAEHLEAVQEYMVKEFEEQMNRLLQKKAG